MITRSNENKDNKGTKLKRKIGRNIKKGKEKRKINESKEKKEKKKIKETERKKEHYKFAGNGKGGKEKLQK